jgi:hypothetical protein
MESEMDVIFQPKTIAKLGQNEQPSFPFKSILNNFKTL